MFRKSSIRQEFTIYKIKSCDTTTTNCSNMETYDQHVKEKKKITTTYRTPKIDKWEMIDITLLTEFKFNEDVI